MNSVQCNYCKSLNIIEKNNKCLCLECNNSFIVKNKNKTNIKNISNKEAHFKNIIKILTNIQNVKYNKELIYVINKIIKEKNIKEEFINGQFIFDQIKKYNIHEKKNYIISFMILCKIKSENPNLNNYTINIITKIFYDFINFLSKNDEINITISYQMLINNILTMFNITNNLIPIVKNNIKDKKYDLWNKYIIDVCKRMLFHTNLNFKIFFNPKKKYLNTGIQKHYKIDILT